MPDPRDIVDIAGIPNPHVPRAPRSGPAPAPPSARPWLGILFSCCGVYSRVYRHPSGRVYTGACPRCGKPFEVTVGPGGTNHRFFEAS